MVVISKLYPEVIKICRPLIIEDEVLKILVKKFSESVSKSLIAEHAGSSNVKCNLTYVTDFPDGTGRLARDDLFQLLNPPAVLYSSSLERGSFIGLDFSGRIFRLAYVGLKGDRNCVVLSRLYEFPYQKLNESITKVVEYVARCVSNFIECYDICEKKIILGVTSCFPMKQECLQDGTILQWGKDFECPDRDGRNFFNLLRVALRRLKNTKAVYLISLVNNSTACLLSGLYRDPGTRIGLYLGDDTNVTYLEKFDNMTAHTGDGLRTRTGLEVEMKDFGDDGTLDFVRTEYDFQIDSASSNPGKYVLDKMVSGAYMGEVARLCLHKLVSSGVLLHGYVAPGLSRRDGLKTSDLAMIEMDEENKFTRCRAVLRNLGYRTATNEDCVQIRFVCRCVAKRSANLIAACMTAMIQRMDTRYVHINADGYLLKEFPHYEDYLVKKIIKLKREGFRFQLNKGEKDETVIGAGIAALIYKDGVIKAEDKRRVLPPVNINNYNLKDIPASCIDCDCEPVKSRTRARRTVEGQNKRTLEEIESAQPVVSVPIAFDPFEKNI